MLYEHEEPLPILNMSHTLERWLFGLVSPRNARITEAKTFRNPDPRSNFAPRCDLWGTAIMAGSQAIRCLENGAVFYPLLRTPVEAYVDISYDQLLGSNIDVIGQTR